MVDTYHWDVLVTYHWDVVGCFIEDLFETSWRRNDGASLLRPFETSLWRSNKTSWRRTTETSWRRSIETSLGVSFETYLLRHWDVQRDVAATLPRRLNAGWVITISSPISPLVQSYRLISTHSKFRAKMYEFHVLWLSFLKVSRHSRISESGHSKSTYVLHMIKKGQGIPNSSEM